jgi:hypothetical protein
MAAKEQRAAKTQQKERNATCTNSQHDRLPWHLRIGGAIGVQHVWNEGASRLPA